MFLFEWDNKDVCCGANCIAPINSEQSSIKKMSCCEVNQGLISVDVDVLSIQSENELDKNQFISYEDDFTSSNELTIKIDASSLKSPPYIQTGWAIRIQYQSFLC